MRVAITGASGFVAQALITRLGSRSNFQALALYRSRPRSSPHVDYKVIGDLCTAHQIGNALTDVDTIVHTAARVHVMSNKDADPFLKYRQINVDSTLNLALQAANTGIKRFIFLSSIKVNGNNTAPEQPFISHDNPHPEDAYGTSKMEAELGLFEIARKTGIEVVCIRPPLVYGPGVKGNFLSLLRWLDHGIPLPLASVYNRRSLVGIDNLVDLITICLDHPAAANQSLLVSDDQDLSTPELIRRTASALGKHARMFPVPTGILKFGARIVSSEDVSNRLLGNLQIDMTKTKELLGWSPPVSVDECLKETASWYLGQRR